MKIKVALAEDVPQLQEAISNNLKGFEGIELLFIASNGQELIDRLSTSKPELILMDINMPVLDGISATRRIKAMYPGIRIVMLTVFDDGESIFNAILAGANGYLLKDSKPSKLLEALEEAMDGGAPMSPQIAAKSLQLIRGNRTEKLPEENDFKLTKRELEILDRLSSGETYQQIADKIFISPKTVRKHIENIYTKLHVHNKVEAIRKAQDHGLLSPVAVIVSAVLSCFSF
jgi:DNA-binding NarL/FixJ family response regulator